MAGKVLVAYGSKYGSTKEIAEKIGEVLKQENVKADVLPIKQVKNLAVYKDIIIGTAIYMGFWRRQTVNFLKKNEKLLAERRVWLFATGPSGKGDPAGLLKGITVPVTTKQLVDRIKTKGLTVFHGYLNEQKLKPWEKWIVKRVGGGLGDFRDWDMITNWAKGVGEVVKK